MLRKLLILCFALSTNLNHVSSVRQDCIYEGDICFIDYQNCLVQNGQFREPNIMEECGSYDIVYGTGKVFETRGEIPFNIRFVHYRESYAEQLTYRIISKVGRHYESIDDCCSVGENETCILPPLKNHGTDRQYVFVPLSGGTDKYCWYPIYEYPESLEWCEKITSTDVICKTFDDGVLKIKNIFEALSTSEIIVDYCFFEAPGHLVNAKRTNETKENDYTRDVIGMTYGEKDGEIRIENKTHSCELTKDVKTHFARHKRSASRAACVFTKTNFDNKWDLTPTCTIPLLKDRTSPTTSIWVTIFPVVFISAVLIFMASFSLWIYRKHIKTCFPDYEKTIKELPNMDVINDIERQNSDSNKNTKPVNKESEVPDLILALDHTKDAFCKPESELESDKTFAHIGENLKGAGNEKVERDSNEEDEITEYVTKQNSNGVVNFCDCTEVPEKKKSDSDSGFSQNTSDSSVSSDDVIILRDDLTYLTDDNKSACDGYTPKNNILTIEFLPKHKYVKKLRVPLSCSVSENVDEEILLRPEFKSKELHAKNSVINTHFPSSHDSEQPLITDGYTAK